MTKFADLHIHTFYSDGTSSPEEIVQTALQAGLSCIAITDHDSLDGIAPTRLAAQGQDLEIISGIELSTEINGKDIHILGYHFDEKNSLLLEAVHRAQAARVERVKTMIEKLKGLGVKDIELEEVCRLTQSKSVGRPHLAAILKEKGAVKDISQAFDKYLGEGCPAYVPKMKQTPQEAIALIRQSGGVAVMAHPMSTNKDELIRSFVEAGLQGIEVYYPNCPDVVIHYYAKLAQKYNVLATGGSDYHGKAKPNTYMGKARIPYEVVEQLKAVAHR